MDWALTVCVLNGKHVWLDVHRIIAIIKPKMLSPASQNREDILVLFFLNFTININTIFSRLNCDYLKENNGSWS